MASKRARLRDRTAARLASSVQQFYRERVGQFLCPTCLSWVPLSDTNNLTEAHIRPKAAGGKITTVLCRHKCNSPFGRRDKWFGEYIRLLRNEKPTFLHADTQRGYFHFGDVRVSGKYEVSSTGVVQFTIFEDYNDPAVAKQLPNQIKETITRGISPPGPMYERRREVSVTVPLPPILDHEDDVTLAVLTAAYLMWFRELGYSWALQHHLEPIRQQIQSQTLGLLPRIFCGVAHNRPWSHDWIGVGTVNGELALFAAVENRVVLFPSVDAPDLYSRLPSSWKGVQVQVLRQFRFGRHLAEAGPFALLYGERFVVAPDVFFKGRYPVVLVSDSGRPQVLYPMSDEEFEKLEREHPDEGIAITTQIEVPDADTGR